MLAWRSVASWTLRSGMGIDQKIVKDTSTNKGKAKQTLNFKAWLVGAADAPDLGNFEKQIPPSRLLTCKAYPHSDTAMGDLNGFSDSKEDKNG